MNPSSLILSGFADEAALDKSVDQQFSAFSAMGLKYLSLRFIDVGGGVKHVMQLTDHEIETVRQKLIAYSLSVSSIGSPIGKVKLLDVEDGSGNRYYPFAEYLEHDVGRACELAVAFDTKLIRGFSFYHPAGKNPHDFIDAAVERLKCIVEMCEQSGLTFGLEVEANLIGQNGEILAEIHRAVGSQAMVLIFDGGNLVTQGFNADEIYKQYLNMKDGLGWIHVKDYRAPEGMNLVRAVDEEKLKYFVPVEMGDAGHRRILHDLREFLPMLHQRMQMRGVPGVFADLEPHLKGGGQFGGFSGPDGFGVALRSFRNMCDEVGIEVSIRNFEDIRTSRGF